MDHNLSLVLQLRRRGEDIRRGEIQKILRRLGPLSPEQERAVDDLTDAIVKRLLDRPVGLIEEMAQEGTSEDLSVIRALLGLP